MTNDPCDEMTVIAARRWAGLRQCGHPEGPGLCEPCREEDRHPHVCQLGGHAIPGRAGSVDSLPSMEDQELSAFEQEREAQKTGRPHRERDWGGHDKEPAVAAGPVRQVREVTTSDGRTLRIGDREAVPQPKLSVRPMRFTGETGKGVKGAFQNGRGRG